MIHPRGVRVIQMDGKRVGDDVMNALTTYVFMYFFVFLGSMLNLSAWTALTSRPISPPWRPRSTTWDRD